MEKSIIKLSRLYTELDLVQGDNVELSKEQAHYLKNVMRKNNGDQIRLFNGKDGEWVCELTELSKKLALARPDEKIREQNAVSIRIHGFFPPIKKQRMDFMIEKAVELGVTDLHPVTTEHTEIRKINRQRIQAQIIEASEQCERLDIPKLHAVQDMFTAIQEFDFPVFAAVERIQNAEFKCEGGQTCGVLVGPEGGFSEAEVGFLKSQSHVECCLLGENILRAETAFIKILVYIMKI